MFKSLAFTDAILPAHRDCKKQTCHQYSDHFIYTTSTLSVLFFSIIERSVLLALFFYYRDMLEIGNDAKNQAIENSQLFFVTRRAQLNAAHAQLLEKLRRRLLLQNFVHF